jgi:hypothetical protein
MKKINIDETVPANRGSCVSVVYPGTLDLPESEFHEETGPVNFTTAFLSGQCVYI